MTDKEINRELERRLKNMSAQLKDYYDAEMEAIKSQLNSLNSAVRSLQKCVDTLPDKLLKEKKYFDELVIDTNIKANAVKKVLCELRIMEGELNPKNLQAIRDICEIFDRIREEE